MKFAVPVKCGCGCEFSVPSYAEESLQSAKCPGCQMIGILCQPLSISVVADKLLYRSKTEIDGEDYTLSIICSAIAVECALTQVFLKWKGIDSLKLTGHLATDSERNLWEKEYRKATERGGFMKSANFVSEFLCGKKFDDFVANFENQSRKSTVAHTGPTIASSRPAASYIQDELFRRRNRIMHWGDVGYQQPDARLCLNAASGFIGTLKTMDREKTSRARRHGAKRNPSPRRLIRLLLERLSGKVIERECQRGEGRHTNIVVIQKSMWEVK